MLDKLVGHDNHRHWNSGILDELDGSDVFVCPTPRLPMTGGTRLVTGNFMTYDLGSRRNWET